MLISFIVMLISGFVYNATNSGFALGVALIAFGSLLQSIYDLYKEDKSI